nr:immunoglobulin heavy chain junction region [Mus musculus]
CARDQGYYYDAMDYW